VVVAAVGPPIIGRVKDVLLLKLLLLPVVLPVAFAFGAEKIRSSRISMVGREEGEGAAGAGECWLEFRRRSCAVVFFLCVGVLVV
jgi:hypothetical protein